MLRRVCEFGVGACGCRNTGRLMRGGGAVGGRRWRVLWLRVSLFFRGRRVVVRGSSMRCCESSSRISLLRWCHLLWRLGPGLGILVLQRLRLLSWRSVNRGWHDLREGRRRKQCSEEHASDGHGV